MAIILPSCSIYDKENNKIVDNTILSSNIQEEKHTRIYKTAFETDDIEIMDNNTSTPVFTASQDIKAKYSMVYSSNTQIYPIQSTLQMSVYIKFDKTNFSKEDIFDTEINGVKYMHIRAYAKTYQRKLVIQNDNLGLVTNWQDVNEFYDDYIPITSMNDNYEVTYTHTYIVWDEENEYKQQGGSTTVVNYGKIIMGLRFEVQAYKNELEDSNNNITADYVQDKNTLISNDTKINNANLSTYIENEIVSNFQKGKETSKIKCSVNNYYNEDGIIAKSISDTSKSMLFDNGDIVIPMILSKNNDEPMSKNQDGTAKQFKVVGVDIEYNGAIWQNLTLLEV